MTPYLVERLAELRRHVMLDLQRAVDALDQLDPVERILKIVAAGDAPAS